MNQELNLDSTELRRIDKNWTKLRIEFGSMGREGGPQVPDPVENSERERQNGDVWIRVFEKRKNRWWWWWRWRCRGRKSRACVKKNKTKNFSLSLFFFSNLFLFLVLYFLLFYFMFYEDVRKWKEFGLVHFCFRKHARKWTYANHSLLRFFFFSFSFSF